MNRLWLLSGGLVFLAYVLSTLVSRGLPPHVNYDSTVFFDHEKLISPSSREELVSMVMAASREGRRVRVLGAGHSWSEVAQSSDLLISLHKYRGLVSVDPLSKQATFKGGTTFHEMSAALQLHSLAMTNLGSISDQTIAGAISTGTHGTGIGFGNLATLVTGIELVTATGEVLQLSTEENPAIFKAAQVSVGLLGVISQVTIQCEDDFNLLETLTNHPLEECLSSLQEFASSAEHVKMWIELHSASCTLFQVNRTTEPVRGNSNMWILSLQNYAFESALIFTSWFKQSCSTIFKVLFSRPPFRPHTRVDKSHNIFNIPHFFPVHYETELVVGVEDCAAAIRAVEGVMRKLAVPKNYPTEIRFVQEDDIWLSPDYKRDSCHITETIYNPTIAMRNLYYNAIFNATRKFAPRLHWGKYFSVTPADMKGMYPMLGEFAKIRKRLDPHGMFLSTKLESSFGFYY